MFSVHYTVDNRVYSLVYDYTHDVSMNSAKWDDDADGTFKYSAEDNCKIRLVATCLLGSRTDVTGAGSHECIQTLICYVRYRLIPLAQPVSFLTPAVVYRCPRDKWEFAEFRH